MPTSTKAKITIGWREWVKLPELCRRTFKAKIDTGARTSALHAFDLQVTETDGLAVATFVLHPAQRSSAGAIRVTWPVRGFRRVRSSNGRVETRPLIATTARLGRFEWPIELTLASRDEMGFRMLLGRSALSRFLVNPGRSFLASKPPRIKTKTKTKRSSP